MSIGATRHIDLSSSYRPSGCSPWSLPGSAYATKWSVPTEPPARPAGGRSGSAGVLNVKWRYDRTRLYRPAEVPETVIVRASSGRKLPFSWLEFCRGFHPKSTISQRVEESHEASTACRDRRCGRCPFGPTALGVLRHPGQPICLSIFWSAPSKASWTWPRLSIIDIATRHIDYRYGPPGRAGSWGGENVQPGRGDDPARRPTAAPRHHRNC
jgi:hypothetical protein